jgi:glycosyltransferase involved in cell wall biosynthesis
MSLEAVWRMTALLKVAIVEVNVHHRETPNPMSSSSQLPSRICSMSLFKHIAVQVGRRYRQFLDLRNKEGMKCIMDRIRRVAAEWIAPKTSISPVRSADVIAVNLSQSFEPSILPIKPGQPLVANWVITPPTRGSGGHTTLFRIIRYLESHGYANRVYFYDAYDGDYAYYESIVRSYYNFQGPMANVESGMEDAHIVFATGWPTAYPIFNSRIAGKRFYFIQDFEPFFYPVGGTSSLAESTYKMDFHGIIIGKSFADKLNTEFGMTVDTFRFGCDISQYSYQPTRERTGIVFYARQENARRGYELGLMTLEVFAARRPDIQIHIYGDKIGKLPFAFVDHGRVTPEKINEIYNQCYAGLSLSFTNVSLVPHEMLAAGCIPVVNDTIQARTDLDNPFVYYSEPYPQALAEQLEALVSDRNLESLSAAAATSVKGISWEDAGATVDKILRRAIAPTTQSEKTLEVASACNIGSVPMVPQAG